MAKMARMNHWYTLQHNMTGIVGMQAMQLGYGVLLFSGNNLFVLQSEELEETGPSTAQFKMPGFKVEALRKQSAATPDSDKETE